MYEPYCFLTLQNQYKKLMNHNFAIIMAGGLGSRFWPTSTSDKPKQFLDVLNTGETLLQQTFRRVSLTIPKKNILIVTKSDYLNFCLDQLPEINKENIICEPLRRNTAPCIALAAFKLKKIDPLANFIVTPSDHLVTNESEFKRIIQLGLSVTAENNILLTLGISPNKPETGYGYIQFKKEENSFNTEIKTVKTFTEKPELELAKSFLETGEFLWNSGIFIWNANSILSAFEKHMPEMYSLFEDGWDDINSDKEKAFLETIYPHCPNESIDYGILEKSSQVYVLKSDFGWSDLGSWGAVYSDQKKNNQGNVGVSENIFLYDSKDNLISLPKDVVAVVEGLNDYIVVQSENRLLICPKESDQNIKKFVTDIKLKLGEGDI
jgi:mannose-1-phosphate guanylyltransferase